MDMEYIGVEQAMQRAGMASKSTILRAIRLGLLPATKKHEQGTKRWHYIIKVSDLDKWRAGERVRKSAPKGGNRAKKEGGE